MYIGPEHNISIIFPDDQWFVWILLLERSVCLITAAFAITFLDQRQSIYNGSKITISTATLNIIS